MHQRAMERLHTHNCVSFFARFIRYRFVFRMMKAIGLCDANRGHQCSFKHCSSKLLSPIHARLSVMVLRIIVLSNPLLYYVHQYLPRTGFSRTKNKLVHREWKVSICVIKMRLECCTYTKFFFSISLYSYIFYIQLAFNLCNMRVRVFE